MTGTILKMKKDLIDLNSRRSSTRRKRQVLQTNLKHETKNEWIWLRVGKSRT